MRSDADREVAPIEEGLARRETSAIDAALAYLEADPWSFRSGYAKQRLVRRLAGQHLSPAQRSRANALILRAVDHGTFGAGREWGRIARRFADNATRRALRARLDARDDATARRAMRVLLRVRNLRLTPRELERVRVLLDSTTPQGPSPTLALEVERFWPDAVLREQLASADRAVARRARRASNVIERLRVQREGRRQRRARKRAGP
jgi:hypothetical protein